MNFKTYEFSGKNHRVYDKPLSVFFIIIYNHTSENKARLWYNLKTLYNFNFTLINGQESSRFVHVSHVIDLTWYDL